MNCGCGEPHDDHGKLANITAADLLRASDANDQTMRESARHIMETLELLVTRQRPAPGAPAGRPAANDRRDRTSIWASTSPRRPAPGRVTSPHDEG